MEDVKTNSTDNVEAFLFELNELLERHKATLKALAFDEMQVTAGGQSAPVTKNYEGGYLEIDPSWVKHWSNDE